MNTIKIRVTKNHIEIIKRNVITSDNVGYVECAFTFDSDWDGTTKNIVLINDKNLPVTDLIKDDKYVIPVSLLTRVWGNNKKTSKLKIGVCGYRTINEQGDWQRITTDFAEIEIVPSSYMEDAMRPPETMPDIYQQLLANMVTDIALTEDGSIQLMAGTIPVGSPIDLKSYISTVNVEYATDDEVDAMLDAMYGVEIDQ